MKMLYQSSKKRMKCKRKGIKQKHWNCQNLVCLLGPISNYILNVNRAEVARKPSKFTYARNKKYGLLQIFGFLKLSFLCSSPELQLKLHGAILIGVPKIHMPQEAYKFVAAMDRLIGQLPMEAPANPKAGIQKGHENWITYKIDIPSAFP
jgi:hypothetical protein